MIPNTKFINYGPFRADQIKDGDRYELSHGNPIYCMPGGQEHANRNSIGDAVISSDPDAEWVGVDAGFAPEPGMLRAPDIAVGAIPDSQEKGWIKGVPALAVEYASVGQDETELQDKIAELLHHGTKLVWVVRLTGARRVEIYESGKPKRIARVTDELTAPGILRNPIPVLALYERNTAKEIVLRNLLQAKGYASLDEVRLEARTEGKIEGQAITLKRQLTHRFGTLPKWAKERIDNADSIQLEKWADEIFDIQSIDTLLRPEGHK